MATLTMTAGQAMQIYLSSPSQVTISNSSWGSLAWTDSTGAAAARTADTANASFKSEMEDMLLTATGGSTYTITVIPISGNVTPKRFEMTVS